MASNKLEGSTFSTSSKSKTSSSKPMNPPSSAMLTQLRIPSNISFFRDLIDKRIVLDERHVKALETTPFHNFLKIPASLSNEQIAIDCLIQNFNSDKCSFLIGNKECAFGIDDIHRITGLRKEGMPIKMNGTAANTIYTQIVKTYKTLKEKMGSSKGKKKVDEEKKTVIWGKRDRMAEMIVDMTTKDPIICVKLIVAFIIGFILCPRTCKTCPLWAFRYADQLSTLKKYNWCHAVFTFLSKEMIKAKKSLSMRGLGQRLNAGYMGDFSSVLLVWFYEKVGELEYTSDIERLPPLFCVKNTGKWRRTTMNKLYRDPKFLTDRASPEGFESRRDELIAIIAKKTSELNELTTELRELEEHRARCMEKNEEKEDNRNVNEENKSNRDKEANEYENVKENEETDFDDDFVMSPRDKKIVEAVRDVSQKEEGGIDQKKETSSIKWAVRKRKRKDGPSVTSPYLRLDQPKEGTKKKHVIQTLDSPEGATKKKCKNEEGCMPTSCNYPGKFYTSLF